MDKKKRTMLLLGAVILIYGAVIVRFVFLSNDNESGEFTESSLTEFRPITYDADMKFSIKNNFRDPFLGSLPKERRSRSAASKSPKKSIKWPSVIYKGLVSDVNSPNQIFAIVINDNEQLLKKGLVRDSIEIISGNSKELVVRFKGERKTIERI